MLQPGYNRPEWDARPDVVKAWVQGILPKHSRIFLVRRHVTPKYASISLVILTESDAYGPEPWVIDREVMPLLRHPMDRKHGGLRMSKEDVWTVVRRLGELLHDDPKAFTHNWI